MPLIKSQTKQNIVSKVTLDSQLAVSIITIATNIDKSLSSKFFSTYPVALVDSQLSLVPLWAATPNNLESWGNPGQFPQINTLTHRMMN